MWRALSRPSQRLEYFRASFFNKQPVVLSLPEFSFSDDAPSLSVFSFRRIPVRLQVPWLSQLRHLGLTSQAAVSELLGRLKEMPLIETFDLDLTTPPFQVPITIDLPNIILPRLRDIRVAGVFYMCTPLLEHINPSPGCALSLDCKYPPMGPNNITTAAEVDYGPLRRVLSRYSPSYLDHHIVTAVLLHFIHTDHPYFGIDLSSDTVKIIISRGEEWSLFFMSAITDFFSSHRANIATIEMVFNMYGDPMHLDRQNGPLLLGFFLSLRSINTLKCHPRFLRFLLGISNGVDVVFPLLRTLKLDDLNTTDDDRSFILSFIS